MSFTTRGAALSALLAAAALAASGVAHADSPAPANPQLAQTTTYLAPGVQYEDDTTSGVGAIRTPLGTVAVRPGQVDVRDGTGRSILGTRIPLPSDTEQTKPVGIHVESDAGQQPPNDTMSDLNQAVAAAAPHMGLGMAVGSTIGSLVGAAVGCPFGVATGGTLMSLASVGTLTVPAIAATCLLGAVAVGGLGATVGGIAVAIPVGIAAGTQKFDQLQAQHTGTPLAPPAG